jgi:hypothetical protein
MVQATYVRLEQLVDEVGLIRVSTQMDDGVDDGVLQVGMGLKREATYAVAAFV